MNSEKNNRFALEERESSYMDLRICNLGEEKCLPGHSFGPAVRSFYLLHYVISGEGIFECGGKTYAIKQNQAFLIYPDIVTFYAASETAPWHYIWLGFDGIFAREYIRKMGLSPQNPVFTPLWDNQNKEILNAFVEILHAKSKAGKTAWSHMLFACFMEAAGMEADGESNVKKEYIDKTVEYISYNYWKDMKVSALADMCGINRSYFCRIFKEEKGMSPQEYIVSYRLNRSLELLTRPELTVAECARSVGYEDSLNFSRIFKKNFGLSPKKYRESL